MNRNRPRHLTASQRRNVKVIVSGLYGDDMSGEVRARLTASTAHSIYRAR